MKLPSDLSGHALVSHIVVQTQDPTPHRVSIPAHKTLRVGTLSAVLRSVANHKGVDRQKILDSIL